MPFIHIKSLPLQKALDTAHMVAGISQDFADQNNIPLVHVHTTWEYLAPGHYAKGDKTPDQQPEAHQPIIVDLLTPDFNDADQIRTMLTTLAASIARRAAFPIYNIFVNHRQAHAGMVFDDGKVVEW
jgi:phenylpyruvate tautomerase PptA (4-oxalocrotonate tautomerase family)